MTYENGTEQTKNNNKYELFGQLHSAWEGPLSQHSAWERPAVPFGIRYERRGKEILSGLIRGKKCE